LVAITLHHKFEKFKNEI